MRTAFVSALSESVEADDRIVLMTGDLGFGVLNDYRERFPEQFLNVGVAEQNLAGVAAGLAMTGSIVFTYSIGNFPTLRCLEQIRNDICYHGADVKIVTVGGGLAYGALGPTHFATEDIAIMRALPDIAVIAPGDPLEVKALVQQIIAKPGPAYLRLGRAGERVIHAPETSVRLGTPTVAREGEDVVLATTGGMLPVAMDAADGLESQHGISSSVISVHALSGFPLDDLADMLDSGRPVISCEEHSLAGGLGSLLAELAVDRRIPVRLLRFGLTPGFPIGVGSQDYLRKVNGIDADALVAASLEFLCRRRP